jgi:hypothetical protein
MHARVRGAILIAAAVVVPATALAQPAEGQPPPPEPEKAPEPPPPPPPPPPAPAESPAKVVEQKPETASRFTWEPYGYLRLQYIVVENDPNVEFVGRDDGFELQNARVGVRGTFDSRAAFVVSIDGAVDEREQINVPEGKLRVGLRDAFADVQVGGKVMARAGFFQSVFDPEALIGDTRRELVDKPIESRGMRATEGYQTQGLTPGHSLGGALRMDPDMGIGFEIAVQNGADEFASNNDNDKPAVSGSLLGRFMKDSWVEAGVRYNPRTVGDLPFRQDENDLQASLGAHVESGPIHLGVGAIAQQTKFPTTGGPDQNAYGAHAQLLFAIPASLPLAVGYRFGILDPSSLIVTDRVMEHTAGAVLGVPRLRMRVQLQLTHVVEQAARTLSNSRAQLAAEVAL